ncbi:endo-1,4-beta-xylanase [Catellatospora sichuanensis]|uniref:endo-1,4-beta-xylanase n=1 Tax=Catellatospora sichuanensis TaxID=1969805 RepID=UPI001182858B|nr:endo-1,4-beta-xylanase [Catellatospora sichuanensis]
MGAVSRLATLSVATVLASSLAVTGGSVPAGADPVALPSLVDDGVYPYPDAAAILAAQNVRLISGDGHIVLADCATPPQGDIGLLKVYTTDETIGADGIGRVCFKVNASSGVLNLQVPGVYEIRGDGQRTGTGHEVTAELVSDAGEEITVEVDRDGSTQVGLGADPGASPTMLLQLRTGTGPAPVTGAQAAVGKISHRGRMCTATLVAPRWALTAGSCFADNPAQPQLTEGAPAGASHAVFPGHAVTAIDWLSPRPGRDVVLARLATPIQDIAPVVLATAAPTGIAFPVVGYGRTSAEPIADQQQTAPVTFTAATGTTLTTGTGPLVCSGMAGAPALNGGKLAAVLSQAGQAGCPGVTGTDSSVTAARTDDLTGWLQAVTATTADPTTLQGAAGSKVRIGSAVGADHLPETAYAGFIAKELGTVTPETELKWEAVEPSRNVFTFDDANAIADLAERHGLDVRGHTLVWHNALPNWLNAYDIAGEPNRQQLSDILEHHVKTVAGNFTNGRVDVWDVVNEPLADDGSRRPDSLWQRRLGDGYIADAFRWAREADPTAKLYLNEYGIETDTDKARALYELVKELQRDGVPIDGVGFQTHRMLGADRLSALSKVMRQFSDLGLDVAITELDVRIPAVPATSAQLGSQAATYASAAKACLLVPRCVSVTTWGFTDKFSWINDDPRYAGWGEATLLDVAYGKKPAYHAMHNVLATTARPTSANADLIGAWRLDDWSTTMAGDSSGLQHPATVTGNALGGEGRTPSASAFRGNGVDTGAATGSAVVTTNSSYTVSAWVRLDSKAADQVIVSQDGAAVSAFTFGYSKATDRWAFSIPSTDAVGATPQAVESKNPPVVGQWTHLTAVWNNGWRHMQLYVNGKWENTFPDATHEATSWPSAGVLRIGRAASGKAFHGAISDIRIHKHAATAGEIAGYADPAVGRWEFNGSLNDTSWFFRDGAMRGDRGAAFTAGEAGTAAKALQVTAEDYVDFRGRQALFTDRSYSVSAWVRLTAAGQSNQIVATQDGPGGQHAFVLKYRGSDKKWAFGIPTAASGSTAYVEIASTSVAAANTWVHVTAVWDGTSQRPRLYVGGNLQATGNVTTSWASSPTGSFHVSPSSTVKFVGAVDGVQIFQHALTDAEVAALVRAA